MQKYVNFEAQITPPAAMHTNWVENNSSEMEIAAEYWNTLYLGFVYEKQVAYLQLDVKGFQKAHPATEVKL